VTAGGPVEVVLAGGGTGGHVTPALALAEALVARGHDADRLRFIGARRGIEARVVPAAGYRIELLGLRGLRHGGGPRAWVANVGAIAVASVATLQAWRLLGRWRPRVVVGTGGYASAAAVLAARTRRIPVVVHEQNAAPGVVNRIAVRLGARAAVAFPGTPLPGAVLTGNPVRAAVAAVVRRPAPGPPLVAVVGGSLGSARLNDAALGLAHLWAGRRDRRLHLVAGARYVAECRRRLAALPVGAVPVEIVGYEDHMEDLYRRAAVVVCRAGALTVAELCVVGVPSVLVPWPGAAGNHQRANAAAVAGAGGGVLLEDADCDATRLAALLDALLDDPDRLARMGAAARTLGHPDAAERLAALTEEVARAA